MTMPHPIAKCIGRKCRLVLRSGERLIERIVEILYTSINLDGRRIEIPRCVLLEDRSEIAIGDLAAVETLEGV